VALAPDAAHAPDAGIDTIGTGALAPPDPAGAELALAALPLAPCWSALPLEPPHAASKPHNAQASIAPRMPRRGDSAGTFHEMLELIM
jgi:hypothetical protein